jgi:hypothetical protein
MNQMVIVTGYSDGGSYGLLGPQAAATGIRKWAGWDCRVVAVSRSTDPWALRKTLSDWFGSRQPVIGFSHLCGREDLFQLAGDLKRGGAVTILAGPQADSDYSGEPEPNRYPHRFSGVGKYFSFALQGPGEQILPVLAGLENGEWKTAPGVRYFEGGGIIRNPVHSWNDRMLSEIDWGNLYRIGENGWEPLLVRTAQVLQHLGCPHAARTKPVELDYPFHLDLEGEKKVTIDLNGCSFCDVARDKGFAGSLSPDAVFSQVACLPLQTDGRRIPFELINENALPGLPELIVGCFDQNLPLSRIHLTLRADWLVKHEHHLRQALHLARRHRMQILLSSVGFESFDDRILAHLNKGLSVETNLAAVSMMRQLKRDFPFQWMYSRRDGANHGLIHPTPWDRPDTDAANRKRIRDWGLDEDILPGHSIPLIIHHHSGLAEWIRRIEETEGIRFSRYVTVIGWWRESLVNP